jgi:hypothetical protein
MTYLWEEAGCSPTPVNIGKENAEWDGGKEHGGFVDGGYCVRGISVRIDQQSSPRLMHVDSSAAK